MPSSATFTTSHTLAPVITPVRDLREYIDKLDAIGEVQKIERAVRLELEIGAVIRRSYELRAPAPLFERIKEVPEGLRVLGAPAGVSAQPGLFLSRIAISLGLPASTPATAIVETLAAARLKAGVKPRVVDSGPCKENVHLHEAVNILELPAPLLHEGDGGRFINTFGTIVARTPDGKWTNWSIARIMVVDRNRMAGIVGPAQHIGRIHAMWKAEGKDMPFALALGVPPAIPFVSGMPLPDFEDEADFIGGYLGEPIDVVKCETNDLFVPAYSEIVLEGRLSCTETISEGPMGEYAGYQWRGVSTPKPVYHVDAITHRDAAILPVVVAGEPIEEDHTAWGIPNAAEVLFQLRKAGVPATMVWPTLEAANHWLVVTVAKTWRETTGFNSQNFCHRLGELVFGSHHGQGMCKLLVFEDDVDATNTREVLWAFATRCHPGTGEIVMRDATNSALAVYLDDGEKHTMTASKAVYNCLTRDEWTGGHPPSRTSFRRGYPTDLQTEVLANWTAYGYAPTVPSQGI